MGHWHVPPLQTAPVIAQACPHVPQFWALLDRFTHAPAHITPPNGHPQTPPEQDSPTGHAVPQLPQFAGSLDVSTQLRVPQACSPAAHVAWQVPVEQTGVVPEQASPQVPQLSGSAVVLVQAELQHASPSAQVVPHAPQLPALLVVSTQAPLQQLPGAMAAAQSLSEPHGAPQVYSVPEVAQTWPVGQLPITDGRHAEHPPVAESQSGVLPEQVRLVHPAPPPPSAPGSSGPASATAIALQI